MSYISFRTFSFLNETYLPENFCECVASFKLSCLGYCGLSERGTEAWNQPWDADWPLPYLGSCVHPVTLCETGLLLSYLKSNESPGACDKDAFCDFFLAVSFLLQD